MRRRLLIFGVAIVSAAAVVAGTVQGASTTGPVIVDVQIPGDVLSRFDAALEKRPVEPISIPADIYERIAEVYSGPTREKELPENSRKNIVIEDNVPFFPYRLSGDEKFRYHPMAYGIFILRRPPESAGPYLRALEETGVEVPNGGLLWFYPDNYSTSRMINRSLASAIGQGQLLGSLASLAKAGSEQAARLAERAYKGLAYPYNKGGVNLADRALLEFPLYDAPPEIILNGWMHALIFLDHYVDVTGDPDAKALLGKNLKFMAEIIDEFDHEATGLSRYSNLSPYTVKIVNDGVKNARFWTFYTVEWDGMHDKAVRLEMADNRSPYENHLFNPRGDYIVNAQVSMAAGYDRPGRIRPQSRAAAEQRRSNFLRVQKARRQTHCSPS